MKFYSSLLVCGSVLALSLTGCTNPTSTAGSRSTYYEGVIEDIEIIDNDDDGDACGSIISIVYKGDHYQVIIRTDEEEEDFVCDTEYVWNERDRVSVKIPKDKIKLKLKTEDKK